LGCSSNSDAPPTSAFPNNTAAMSSGLDPGLRIESLARGDRVALCDWVNARATAASRALSCDGVTKFPFAASRDACLANIPAKGCDATVANFEACTRGLSQAERCESDLSTPPECRAIQECLNAQQN